MKTTITGISGIGPQTAKTLHEHGFNTLSAIAGATIAQLSSVPGFGTTRASRVIRAANELLATSATRPQPGARKKPAGSTTKSGEAKAAPAKKSTINDRQKATLLKKEKASKAKLKKEKEARQKKAKEKKARLKKEKEKAAKAKKEKAGKAKLKKGKEAKAGKKKPKRKKDKK